MKYPTYKELRDPNRRMTNEDWDRLRAMEFGSCRHKCHYCLWYQWCTLINNLFVCSECKRKRNL